MASFGLEEPRKPRGFSLTEVMIAVVILGLALMPLLTTGRATHRQTYFAEHHMIASTRARTILDLVSSLDFAILDWIARKSPGGAAGNPIQIDLEKLLEPGGLELLFAPALDTDPKTLSYLIKLRNFEHRVTYTRKSANLGEVKVSVKWVYAGDKKDHEIVLTRLVYRGEHSHTVSVPFRS